MKLDNVQEKKNVTHRLPKYGIIYSNLKVKQYFFQKYVLTIVHLNKKNTWGLAVQKLNFDSNGAISVEHLCWEIFKYLLQILYKNLVKYFVR